MENFITEAIDADLKSGRYEKILTRFPPEPNGYLHLGHAKSLCLNFGLAEKYGGSCNLRLDDTNPLTEKEDFVTSIINDIDWLGFNPSYISYASDYFDELYKCAVVLIKIGKAYVCELDHVEIGEYRGVPTEPGEESPYKNRPIEENLKLFEDMKNGLVASNRMSLRAKIDMTSPNMHLRDPVLYRISKMPHYRTGTKWSIYPSYDFAHPLCDSFERISHSVCTLEFEIHRPLYDWIIENCGVEHKPRQIEFARLNLEGVSLSKRKLAELVGSTIPSWDNFRMPTIAGLRNRGVSAAVIKTFSEEIGISKMNGVIELAKFNSILRDELNLTASRVMAVADPLRIKVPDGVKGLALVENNPEDFSTLGREIVFSDVFYISNDDFMEDPPKGYFRLSPGKEVRLKAAGIVKCVDLKYDFDLSSNCLICEFDPDTSKKVKGTIQWVDAKTAVRAHVIELAPLFSDDEHKIPHPNTGKLKTVFIEPLPYEIGHVVQFMRMGYYKVISKVPLVFQEIVSLKDSWNKGRKDGS